MRRDSLIAMAAVLALLAACKAPERAAVAETGAADENPTMLTGLARTDDIRLSSMRTMVETEYMEKANLALARLVRGQELADQRLYRDALVQVMESIYIFPTADAYAMAGSLYFVMDDRPTAVFYWTKAVESDPQIGRRGYAGLNDWIRTR